MTLERDMFLNNCMHIVSIAIIYYDHILTFSEEMHFMWSRPFTRGSWVFLLNRYVAFVGYIAVTVVGFTFPSMVACARFMWFRQYLVAFSAIVICVVISSRTYALYGCSKRILWLLIGVASVLTSIAAWAFLSLHRSERNTALNPLTSSYTPGCPQSLSAASASRMALAWVCLVGYDTLLVALILARAWTRARTRISVRSSAARDLAAVIVRDGVLYYAAVALVNGANIVTFYAASAPLKGALTSPASALAVTLCARLMLNLRASAAEDVLLGASDSTLLGSVSALGEFVCAEPVRIGRMPCDVETAGVELAVLQVPSRVAKRAVSRQRRDSM